MRTYRTVKDLVLLSTLSSTEKKACIVELKRLRALNELLDITYENAFQVVTRGFIWSKDTFHLWEKLTKELI